MSVSLPKVAFCRQATALDGNIVPPYYGFFTIPVWQGEGKFGIYSSRIARKELYGLQMCIRLPANEQVQCLPVFQDLRTPHRGIIRPKMVS